ncbi:MAG: D-aminoacyl-tRNA deacylase [Candidatus Hermodarchaeota archaeon]
MLENDDVKEFYLGLTDEPLIHLNDLKLEGLVIDPDVLIFASRHKSKTSRPALLTHTTGNWGKQADFGGNPREISYSSALLLKSGFLCLKEEYEQSKLEDFSLDIEVTHHGPTTLKKPLIFIELGSTEEEWNIAEAGSVVANAIIKASFQYLKYQKTKDQKIGVGFGGTHYAPQFKKLILEKDVAISFICPKYFIEELTESTIKQMINHNIEDIDLFIINWKGTNSEQKKHLIPLLENFDIPVIKSKDV